MLGLLASLIGLAADAGTRQRYRQIARDPFFVASLVLVLSALPSVLMSQNFSRALRDWKSYWILLVYFLVAYNLLSAKLRTVVFWTLFGSMTLSSSRIAAGGWLW